MEAAHPDGMTVLDGAKIYSHLSSFYRATGKLRERGIMKKDRRDNSHDRYVLTERGVKALEVARGDDGG